MLGEENFLKRYKYKAMAEVGRPIDMEQVAEYGIAVRNKKPMQPGTILNFHSRLLTDPGTGRGAIARCYGFEEHPTEDGQFLLHFTFYGIQDNGLKRIRKWIREEYVQEKSKEG